MAAATTATAKTVSQPLQLEAGNGTSEVNGNKRRRIVKPGGKITLTSLTENNVGRAVWPLEVSLLMGLSHSSGQ